MNEWPDSPEASGQEGGDKSISGDAAKWVREIPTRIHVSQILTAQEGSRMLTHLDLLIHDYPPPPPTDTQTHTHYMLCVTEVRKTG